MSFDTQQAREAVSIANASYEDAKRSVYEAEENLRRAILNQIEADAGEKITRRIKSLVADLITKRKTDGENLSFTVFVDPNLFSGQGDELGKSYNVRVIVEEYA